MNEPVLSTFKILMQKSLNKDIDETWIDWAAEMMEAGFESHSLYILAGITKPYNQFELQQLTSKVLTDLKLDFSDREKVVKDYVYFLISCSINNVGIYLKTLRDLKDLCFDLDMDDQYMDFYLLYWAKDDLTETESQYYWDGADRENIDQIITEYFKNWKMKYQLEKTEIA